MLVMGLNPMVFYLSHFLIGYLKVFFIILICAGTLSYGFFVSFKITKIFYIKNFFVFFRILVPSCF